MRTSFLVKSLAEIVRTYRSRLVHQEPTGLTSTDSKSSDFRQLQVTTLTNRPVKITDPADYLQRPHLAECVRHPLNRRLHFFLLSHAEREPETSDATLTASCCSCSLVGALPRFIMEARSEQDLRSGDTRVSEPDRKRRQSIALTLFWAN